MMNPFIVTEENKKMVVENIGFLLRNFLNNPSYKYVIFNWVIDNEEIFETVLRNLEDIEFQLYKIILICSPERLKERMIKDGREEERIENSINRLNSYKNMDTYKIDTTNIGIEDVVNEILELIE